MKEQRAIPSCRLLIFPGNGNISFMKSSNKKWTAQGSILLGFLIATLVIAGACYYVYDQVNQFVQTVESNQRPAEAVDELAKIVGSLSQGEGSVLAYIITRDTAELAPYSDMLATFLANDLRELAAEDSVLENNIMVLDEIIQEKLLIEKQLISIVGDTALQDPYDLVYADLTQALKELPASGSRPRRRSRRPQITQNDPPAEAAPSREQAHEQQQEEIQPARPGKFHIFGIGLTQEEKTALKKWRKLDKEEKERLKRQEEAREAGSSSSPKREKGEVDDMLDHLTPKSPPAPVDKTDWDFQNLPQDPKKLVRTILDSIERRGVEHSQLLEVQQDSILRLVYQDRALMQQVVNIFQEIEARDERIVARRAQEYSQRAQYTPRLIAVFGGIVLLLFIVLLVIIFRDIARNRRLNRQLEAETERAHRLAHAKEEFLANMSHDIRTPMNAIIGFTEQLMGTPLNRQQNKFLHTIRHSGRYLLELINDVLDYSKLESGSFELEYVSFSPAKVLDEVYETFHTEAEKKGLRLSCKYDDKLPAAIEGDPLRLKQMLFNLTNNAIKFTEKGAVTIQGQVMGKRKQEVQLAFSVADTGIGIPPDKLDGIFKEYGQAESSTSRKFGGTGLGLSITRKLAEMHGGRIDVQSEAGRGSVFTLLIPYQLSQSVAASAEPQGAPLDQHALRNKRALLADDEPFNRYLLETIMEKWGVQADSVENGRLAVERMKAQAYDFVLIDLQMPEMDGMQATQAIRTQLKRTTPIIALTATSTPKEVEKALQSGINDVLLKPFQEEVLMSKLLAILQGTHQPSLMQEIYSHMPKYQLEDLYKLTGNNKAKVQHLLEIFARQTPEDLRLMQKASQQKDWQTLSDAAHKLIPKVRALVPAMEPRLRYIKEQADARQNLGQLNNVTKEVTRQLIEIVIEVEKDIQSLKKGK